MQDKGRYYYDIATIDVWDGRYSITTSGDVISHSVLKHGHNRNGDFSYYTKERVLSVRISPDGYKVVSLCDGNGTNRTCFIHRLIALAFIPNPNNLPQVNHIDGNKLNNSIENLEWVTSQENVVHSYETGLASNAEERHPRSVLTHGDILKIAELFVKGVPCIEMVPLIGKKYCTIYKVIEGKNWKNSFQEALNNIKKSRLQGEL